MVFSHFDQAMPGWLEVGGAATLEGNGACAAVQFAPGILPCFCLSGPILLDRQPISWELTQFFQIRVLMTSTSYHCIRQPWAFCPVSVSLILILRPRIVIIYHLPDVITITEQ